jgi:uridine kinase
MFNDVLLETLHDSIESLLKKKERVLVAIDGKCGSGKTTLAACLAEGFDCNVFHMDDFFLRPEQRTPERFREPGGNVDYERFKEEVMDGLLRGIPFAYRPFNCATMSLASPVWVQPKKLNLIEGSYSLHPTLSAHYDLKVFLTLDDQTQQQRILMRNGPEKLKRFIEEWIPRENLYFETMNIMAQCNIVYENGLSRQK